MPVVLNRDKVERALKNFADMVHVKQGDFGSKISFKTGFPEEQEGYKRRIYRNACLGIDRLDSQKDTKEAVKEKYLTAVDFDDNNLLDWRDKSYIKEKIEEQASVDLIYDIYTEPGSQDNDEKLFKDAIKLWGSRFPIISFTFFLKDMSKYPPVRPKNFKMRLAFIDADAKCMNNCTWENYQQFIRILKEVQKLMNESGYFSPEADLIDAHSFVWMLWMTEFEEDMTKFEEKYEDDYNMLFYGVPGSGKSYTVNEIIMTSDPEFKRTERVVFHPEYSYSDFVGQILPQTVSGGGITYSFHPGSFTRILKKAIADPEQEYYLVIEEINRGNAPAIFGDIFQLLDRNDKGESVYSIYNADVAKEVYGNTDHEVKLPTNLKIMATMNTSDQNVFTLDTAFQRRWQMEFIENDIEAAEHANQNIEKSDITWAAFATTVNEYILEANEGMLSSEDKRLGAYFVDKDELSKTRFPQKVLKYLWDDAFRLERDLVFKEEYKSLDAAVKKYTVEAQAGRDPLKAVFKTEVYDKMTNAVNRKQKNMSETKSGEN